MPMFGFASFTALAAAASAHTAGPQTVRPQDPASLVSALHNAGYPATLSADGTGDPMIQTAAHGTKMETAALQSRSAVTFYGCTKHRQCNTIEFRRDFTMAQPVPLTQLNDWNQHHRFTRAFNMPNGDVALAMDVDLDEGGVAPLLFIDNVEFWWTLMPQFEKFVGYANN